MKLYKAFVTCLIEAESETEAVKIGQTMAEYTNEYLGSHASGDPLVYRVTFDSLQEHKGPAPWDVDE